MKELVEGLDIEEMGRGGGGCGRAFTMVPESGGVFSTGDYGAFPNAKTLGGELVVEDDVQQLKIKVGDISPEFVKGNQVHDRIQ